MKAGTTGECILNSKVPLDWAKFTSLILPWSRFTESGWEKKCWWMRTVFLFFWRFVYQYFSQKIIFKSHEVSQVFQTLLSLILAHQNAAHRALGPHVLAKTVRNFGKDILKSFVFTHLGVCSWVSSMCLWEQNFQTPAAISIYQTQSNREFFIPGLPAALQLPMGMGPHPAHPGPSQTPEPAALARPPSSPQSCSPPPPGSSRLFHGSYSNYSTIWQLRTKSSMNSFLRNYIKWGRL